MSSREPIRREITNMHFFAEGGAKKGETYPEDAVPKSNPSLGRLDLKVQPLALIYFRVPAGLHVRHPAEGVLLWPPGRRG